MMEDGGDIEAQLDAQSQIQLLINEFNDKKAYRLSNTPSGVVTYRREHEANKKQLKSDLKKASTFVSKLRSMNTEAIQQCIRDVEALNLTLYISEIVGAISDIAFKPGDVPAIVKLCVALHRRYEDFAAPLLEKVQSALLLPAAEVDGEKDVGKKKRVQIRLLLELLEAGVLSDDGYFIQLARVITGRDRKSGQKLKQPLDLMSLSTFIKYSSEPLLGLPSKSSKALARIAGQPVETIPLNIATTELASTELRDFIVDMYQQLCIELVKSHKEYRKKEKKSEKDRLIHGALSEQKQLELDQNKRIFEKLFTVLTGVAESLGNDLPALEEEQDEDELLEAAASKGVSLWEGAKDDYQGPFGDPESRAFYEDLPDLLCMVPLSVLGITEEQAEAIKDRWKIYKESKYTVPVSEDDGASATDAPEGSAEETNAGVEPIDEDAQEVKSHPPVATLDEGEKTVVEDTPHARVMLLIEDKLPDCNSRAKCDEFCVNFAFLNSKGARKRLAVALAKIPRGRAELVSTYARIVASMNRVFADIAPMVLDQVTREAHFLSKTKTLFNANQIENKMKSLRYLGELVKFGVAPPILALKAFKGFLADFSSHNVDFMTTLLESCGRLLYLLPHTSDRIQTILDTMLRLRRSRFLDIRQQSLIDSAYFAVKPPDKSPSKKKELTTVQKYIKYLFIDRLCNPKVFPDEIIRSIRKLPFATESEKVEHHIIKHALKLSRTKYICIGVLSDCLAGLLRYRPNLIIKLVDIVVEEILRGLDMPYKRDHQRMIGFVRLLGEMYNYTILSSTLIFDMFYTLIHYGHAKLSQFDSNRLNATTTAADGPNSAASSNGPIATFTPVTSIFILPQFVNMKFSDGGPSETAAVPVPVDGEAQKRKLLTSTLLQSRFDPAYYDPRVPAEIDPPHDLFRSQLVVELVNTCGEYFIKGANKDKFNRFLLYFQRYLLCKQAIPLHVEFAILDMFDQLEEHAKEGLSDRDTPEHVFTRYTDFEVAQTLIEAIEIKAKSLGPVAAEEFDENAEESSDEEDGGEAHTKAERDEAVDNSEHGDERSDEDGSNHYPEEEEEEEARLINRKKIVEEDDEFEKAFRAVMMDSIESVSRIPGGVFKSGDVDRMAIPAVLPKPKNILRPVLLRPTGVKPNSESSTPASGGSSGSSDMTGKVFKMLSRDVKGRVETKQLMLPEDNSMVVKLQKSEEAARIEKQKIKEKVLQFESRDNGDDDEFEEAGDYFSFGQSAVYTTPRVNTQAKAGGRGRGGRSNSSDGSQQSQGQGRGRGRQAGRGTGSQPNSGSGISNPNSGGSNTSAYIYGRRPTREEEMRKPTDSLNLNEFLAEVDKIELRRLQASANPNIYTAAGAPTTGSGGGTNAGTNHGAGSGSTINSARW